MKITRILSASVLAGAMLLAGTACSMTEDKKSESATSAAAQPTQSQGTSSSNASEPQAVAATVNGFYAYAFNKENVEDIQKAAQHLNGNAAPNEEDLKTLIANLPEGFKYFDTSSPELIKNAYGLLLVGAMVGDLKMEITVPEEAVTVEGDTATVDPAKIVMTVDGKKTDNSTSSSDLIKLKKNEAGSWVMVAESTMNGSGEAELNTEK